MEPIGFWATLARLGWEPVAIGMLLLLLAAFIHAILSGRLIPRAIHEETRQDRDLWKQAHAESEKTRQAQAELMNKNSDMLDKVIVQGAIANELLNQLRYGVEK